MESPRSKKTAFTTLKTVLSDMERQVALRISFPLSYMEERALLAYIRTLEREHAEMKGSLYAISCDSYNDPALQAKEVLSSISL